MRLGEFTERLKACTKLVFFTGAGISTESGVPDFRSPGGIWTKYEPVYFDDFLRSEEARRRHWKMKKETHELYKNVRPNAGHYAVAEFERRNQLLGLITQNVDGLHSLAGVSSDKIVELHGTDRFLKCLDCEKEFEPELIYQTIVGDFRAPTCDACGGFIKTATISFGQPMPMEAMRRAQRLSEESEIFLVIGTSLQVQPAASLPVIAKRSGALLAIINRDPTPLDDFADLNHRGAIGPFFTALGPLLNAA